MERAEKAAFVASLHEVVKQAGFVLVTQQSGLTVAEATDLRARVRKSGARYKVAKNRLAMLALKGTTYEGLSPLLKGPTAITTAKDPVAAAKAVSDFADKNEKLKILGASLGGRQLNAKEVKALASLPSLDELRGKIVGLILAPATKIAGILQAPAGQLARVVAAKSKAG